MGLLFFHTKHRARVASLASAVLCLGSLFLIQASPARADGTDQSTASADSQIDLDIVNANLLSVVRMLRIKSGAQIVVVGGDQSYHPVTLTVSGTLPNVLRYVAMSASATVTQNSDGVYVIRPSASGAASDGSAQAANAANSDMNASPQDEPTDQAKTTRPIGPMHLERIVLKNVDPDFILKMINDPSGYRDTNPYHDPSAMETFSPIPGQKNYDGNVIQGSTNINMLAQSIQPTTEQPSVPMGNQPDGTTASMTANRSTTEVPSQAQQFVTPGGGGFFPGGGFGGGGGPGGFGNQAPGQGGPGGFGANGQRASLRPEGIDQIIANEQDNSLLVRGDAQGISELKQIISLLDVPSKQVQIKVEFITANVTDVNTFGINWDLVPFPNVEAGTQMGGSLPTGGTFLSFAQGNLVSHLFTFLSTGKGKNISSPIITTTNNTPASIFENIQIPYVTTTTVAGATGGAIQGQSVNFLNVPTGLTVLPRINGDNSVTLVLSPTLQVPGVAVIPNGPPPVTSEGLTTIRTVADGETMVLGGLVTKNDTNTTIKVPILGDLPLIGSLFRTKNENINNTELLIFVTPTVLPAPGAEASLSGGGGPTTVGIGGGGIGVTP